MNIEQTRACLENDFCKMCVTVYEKFVLDEGVVASYDNRIRDEELRKMWYADYRNDFEALSKPHL